VIAPTIESVVSKQLAQAVAQYRRKEMIFLGNIFRLQIQRTSLKREVGDNRLYDPSSLLIASELVITTGGAWVHAEDNHFIADVHHVAHPQSRHRGKNSLSVGFTSHYDAMQSRFGEHIRIGCAGENIIIECAQRVNLADIAGGLHIETKHGHILLGNVVVAHPCRPFSDYVLAKPTTDPAQRKAALQFLDAGTRGYYGELCSASPATVAIGDAVYAVSHPPTQTSS
jgi:hypothetical protein